MPRTRLLTLLAVLLSLLCLPAAASAAPDPVIVAKDAKLIDDGLTTFTQRSSPTDTQYFSGGTWRSDDATWWAYSQGGPASAAAVLWRSTGETRADLYATATSAIDTAIATHQRADGAFAGDPGDNQSASIATNMYVRELGVAYLALQPRLDATRKAAWSASIARAADFLIATGENKWYTNGNIELGELELMYLAARITGQPRFATAYEAQWSFALSPDQVRWPGFGLRITRAPARADGADGAGYLGEASGPGAPGFDAEYTGVQLDIATRLWALTRDPRALRLMNLEVNQLLPRVNTTTWQLDTSNGTRHVEASRSVPFLTQALAVLAGSGRPELASSAASQWTKTESTYRGTYRYTSVTFYKGLGAQLSSTLLDAMATSGGFPTWTPPANAAPAETQEPAGDDAPPAEDTPAAETPAPAADTPAPVTPVAPVTVTAPLTVVAAPAPAPAPVAAPTPIAATLKPAATPLAKATTATRILTAKAARVCAAAARVKARRGVASKAKKQAATSCAKAKAKAKKTKAKSKS